MASVIKLHATGMPVMVVFFVTGFYHVHNMTMANQPLVIDRYVIKMNEAIRRPGNCETKENLALRSGHIQ